MIRFLFLTLAFGGLSWLMWRERMPDPLLGYFVGTAMSFAVAFVLTWSVSRRFRALRRHPAVIPDRELALDRQNANRLLGEPVRRGRR
jgi:hypothetical protein